jgi:membrane protein YqaA with SNARE-associated domain
LVALFGLFLNWWGAFLLGALDSSLVFFMPFGIDALVIYLAARDQHLFWIYPLLATAGSLAGASLTFWIGHKIGEVGLERFVQKGRLERFRSRISTGGAVALALPAVLPPPFPLTPFLLTCGALDVNRKFFFSTFAAMRLVRFSAGALLARVYGAQILRVVQSDSMQMAVVIFIVVAILGTLVSAAMLWRNTHVLASRA